MKTVLPQAPDFRRFLALAHDGAKRDFSIQGFERDGLHRIAQRARKLVSDLWPLEGPYGGCRAIGEAVKRLQDSVVSAVLPDDLPEVLASIKAVDRQAMAMFDALRLPPSPALTEEGQVACHPAAGCQRFPVAVHRAAQGLWADIRFQTNQALILRGPAHRSALAVQQVPLLNFSHVVALIAVARLADAVDAMERLDELTVQRLHSVARSVRPGAGARSPAWRAAVELLRESPGYHTEVRLRLQMARHAVDSAAHWLRDWHADVRRHRAIEEAAAAGVEDQLARSRRERSEAARPAALVLHAQIEAENRQAVAVAWNRLLLEQRGRMSASIIAKATGLNPRTVRQHLRALGLYEPK